MWLSSNLYVITSIAVIGGALFGFNISSMSAILPIRPYKCYFQQGPLTSDGICTGPNTLTQGGIIAAMPAGSWATALISGHIADAWGRRAAIGLGAGLWIVGSIITSAAQNIPMLIVGRVVNGFCVGICSAQIPVYITEISPPEKRGRLVGLQQWATTWGILIMFFVSYACSTLKSEAAFRIPWGIQAIPGAFLLFGMLILPESPRWLARQNRWQECRQVVVDVLGHGDNRSPLVVHEISDIEITVAEENLHASSSYLELFSPHMLNRTFIGVFVQIWGQLTGINVMMYYITYIFQMTGKSSSGLLLSSSIQYVINVLMTVPGLLWIDIWGRRQPLLAGAVVMCACLAANAGIFATYSIHRPDGINGTLEASMELHGPAAEAVIAFSYIFVGAFACTWGPVSWVYPSELFPLRIRSKAVALATSANWALNFALAWFVPVAFVTITWKVYLIFAIFCGAMFAHVFFMFPETAKRPLEMVTELFENEDAGSIPYVGTPAWKTARLTKAEMEELASRDPHKTRDTRRFRYDNQRDGPQDQDRVGSLGVGADGGATTTGAQSPG